MNETAVNYTKLIANLEKDALDPNVSLDDFVKKLDEADKLINSAKKKKEMLDKFIDTRVKPTPALCALSGLNGLRNLFISLDDDVDVEAIRRKISLGQYQLSIFPLLAYKK